jgi:riboflavin-specific deaminase-like protein
MAGASTINSAKMTLGPGGKEFRALRRRTGLSEYNLRVIVSGSGKVSPRAEIFRHKFSPIIILTTERIPRLRLTNLQRVATEVKICGNEEIDFIQALSWLRSQWGVRSLLCEGGGELNAALLESGLVHELNLTIAPKIFAGRDAPTIADGPGIPELSDAIQLELKSSRRISDEMFLAYRVLPRRMAARPERTTYRA